MAQLDVLQAINSLHTDTLQPVTTNQIIKHLGINQRTLRANLRTLAKQKKVYRTKQVGEPLSWRYQHQPMKLAKVRQGITLIKLANIDDPEQLKKEKHIYAWLSENSIDAMTEILWQLITEIRKGKKREKIDDWRQWFAIFAKDSTVTSLEEFKHRISEAKKRGFLVFEELEEDIINYVWGELTKCYEVSAKKESAK